MTRTRDEVMAARELPELLHMSPSTVRELTRRGGSERFEYHISTEAPTKLSPAFQGFCA